MCDHERGKKVNVIHQVMAYHLSKTSFVYFGFFSYHLDARSLAQLASYYTYLSLISYTMPLGHSLLLQRKKRVLCKEEFKESAGKNPRQ